MKVSEELKDKTKLESLITLCKLFGKKLGTYDASCLNTESLEIIVDGREIADEYEGLPNEAPCKVDYIACDNDKNNIWFHMYSNFSTNFPLVSNDKYGINCLSEKQIDEIYDYFFCIYENHEIDEENKLKLKRSEWLKMSEKLLTLPDFDLSIQWLIEIRYCCHGKESGSMRECKENDGFIILMRRFEMEENPDYLNGLDKDFRNKIVINNDNYCLTEEDFLEELYKRITPSVALGIRVKYPTYQLFKRSGRLAFQSNGRYERWLKVIPKVYKKALDLCNDDTLNKALSMNPDKYFNKIRII